MRLVLAMLAVLGLLLSPAAATAAAHRCAHHMGEGGVAMMPMPASATSAMAKHDCCDDHGKPPKHDAKACAQDCAAMGAVVAALPAMAPEALRVEGHAILRPALPKAFQAHAPPRLERPPRQIA